VSSPNKPLKVDFDELRERIRAGRELNYASFEPIFYLVFEPERIIEVKRQTPALTAALKKDGWQVHVMSMSEEIEALLGTDPRRNLWDVVDRREPQNWQKTNDAIANALSGSGALLARLEAKLASLEGKQNQLLMVTDLEALHPYMRIGAIEGQLQGRFHVPTVFLYPGSRAGKTQLRFLGFYPEDGNYRSVHVGG
jgi:hypothetical protein